MNKKELEKQEENNMIALVDQSGVETAIGKLVEKNNAILPKNIVIEKIKNKAGMYISKREDLMNLPKAEKLSMLYGVLTEAMVGCEAGTDYDIVPFKNKAVVTRNKRGWFKIINLIVPSPIILFRTGVVFEGDDFDYDNATGELIHKPRFETNEDYNDIKGAWARIKLQNGFSHVLFMSKAQIDRKKKASPAGNSSFSPWSTMPATMVDTKVTKEMAKYLNTLYGGNLDTSMLNAIDSDEIPVKKVDSNGYVEVDKSIYETETIVEEPKKINLENL